MCVQAVPASLSSPQQEAAVSITPQKSPVTTGPAKVIDVPAPTGSDSHSADKGTEPAAKAQSQVSPPEPQPAAEALQPPAAAPEEKRAEALPPTPAAQKGPSIAAAEPRVPAAEAVETAQQPSKQSEEATPSAVLTAEEPEPAISAEETPQKGASKSEGPVKAAEVGGGILDGEAPSDTPGPSKQVAKRDASDAKAKGAGTPAQPPTSTPADPAGSSPAHAVQPEQDAGGKASKGKDAALALPVPIENGEAAPHAREGKPEKTSQQVAEPTSSKKPLPKPQAQTPKTESAAVRTALPAEPTPAKPAQADGVGLPGGDLGEGKGEPQEAPHAPVPSKQPTASKEPAPAVPPAKAEPKTAPAGLTGLPAVDGPGLAPAAVEVETAAFDMLEEPAVEEELDYGEGNEDAVASQARPYIKDCVVICAMSKYVGGHTYHVRYPYMLAGTHIMCNIQICWQMHVSCAIFKYVGRLGGLVCCANELLAPTPRHVHGHFSVAVVTWRVRARRL